MDVPALKRAYSAADSAQGTESEGLDARPLKSLKRGDVQAASQRHIKTEQARRDKISAGFQALQGLMPGREKVEKAMLLTQAAEYISQLQGVLQMLMSSGAISKLPDELQFQIRTLLPRKDGKPLATAVVSPPEPAPTPALTAQQQPVPGALPSSLQLPFLPLMPAAVQVPDMTKELPQDEATLMTQIQGLLQQQQQAAAAAQQLQTWQQTLQALQLQQVLTQQQGQCVPEMLTGLGGLPGASNPLTSLGFMAGQPLVSGMGMPQQSSEALQNATATRRPGDCFADELPKCGLQQLMDAAACEPSNTISKPVASPPHKARKNAVKVRRHTTAARIPKPDAPNPARVGAGRPEPV